MKLISELYNKDVGFNNEKGKMKYEVRKASRAVLVNEHNQIAILYVSKDEYYKLPGGGIEENETILEALSREIFEEVGSDLEVLNEIGMTIEYRDRFEQLQISYCFIAKTKGELTKPHFTQKERNRGFELKWMDFEEAVNAINAYNGQKYIARFITKRDVYIIKEAGKLL